MKYLLPVLLLLVSLQGSAQNLCPNGSFEQYTTCPTGISQIDRATGWFSYTQIGTPDYSNNCSSSALVGVPSNLWGYQFAAQGDAYAGLYNYTPAGTNGAKEYLARPIMQLSPGTTYEVSMSVSLANNSAYGNNGLGVFFYDNGPTGSVNITTILPFSPQVSYASYGAITDTTVWTRLTGNFIADSAYDNIIIGGFLDNSTITAAPAGGGTYNASYYYVDSVVIRPFGINFNFSNPTLCTGDTIVVPYTLSGATSYGSGNTFALQLSNAAGSFASPITIGTLTSTIGGSITGVVPASASGTGYRLRIVSTAPQAASLPNSNNIQIKPTPAPPVATGNAPVCSGSTLQLAATSVTAGVNYNWTGPNGFSSSAQNPSVSNAALANSGNYMVSAILNGCAAADTIAILVKPMPSVATIGSNSPVCGGNSLNLTATSTTSGVSYNWTGPLSYASATQNPTLANATTAMSGNYNVTVTLNGCTSAAATAAVTVNLTPAIPTATSNTPVCAGGILNLNATSITPGVNYNWTGPNGFTSNAQNPSISPVSLTAGGTYNVTAELNGCTSAMTSTNVIVNNVSSLGVYPSPNDTLCANNTTATFVAVPFNAGAAPQYQWYKNNNLIVGATNISYPATGIANGDSFYCRMTVTGLCADPLVLYSNKVGMTVLPLTSGPSVSITADPGLLLSPWQLVKFTAVATNAGVLPKYQWKRNSQDVIGANGDNWSANNLSNGDTISCVVTSDIWCATPASAVSNRMVVNIKLGVEDIDGNSGVKLYPNPNKGSFSLLPPSSQGGGAITIKVVDALGRTVYTDRLPRAIGTTLKIELPPAVANGVYMLKLHADGAVYHARFTVSR